MQENLRMFSPMGSIRPATTYHAAQRFAWRRTWTDKFIRIGYAGGSRTHQCDFGLAIEAITRCCDLILAPLEFGNPFGEAKSELKFFEAALVGVPTIARRDHFATPLNMARTAFSPQQRTIGMRTPNGSLTTPSHAVEWPVKLITMAGRLCRSPSSK
jgi:hypothetical protein